MKHASIPNVPTQLFLGGEWRDASDGGTFAVDNPATGEIIAEVASATVEDGMAALDAAEKAFAGWAELKPRERGEVLRKAFELIMAQHEELSRLITLENGKALPDSRGEVSYAAEFFRWSSEEAVRAIGDLYRGPSTGARIVVGHKPAGISVLVTPWNFPAAMATRKIGPALAAGCPVILKPASATPLTMLALMPIMEQAGVPKGIISVLPSSHTGKLVDTLLHDPRVRVVSFTGSTEVGRKLLHSAADNIVNPAMELGGNAPFVVLDDADIDKAVDGAIVAKMRNIGEACTAANRFYVHDKVHDTFADRLAAKMGAMKVGNGLDDGVEVGSLVNAETRDKVVELVADAVKRGAKVLTGGAIRNGPGYFYQPTVLVDVPDDARCFHEEIFGPVAALTRFSDERDMIKRCNDTEYGLVAYVFTKDMKRGMAVSEQLDFGMIGLNRGLVSDPAAPFGGMKQSGIGREGAHHGIMEFLETQYISVEWEGLRRRAMDVIMPQLGETVAEGKVSAWFKAPGDSVAAGENLFEIETDKVTMEVQALAAGVLSEIRVQTGETVPVGAVVAVIGESGAAATERVAHATASPSPLGGAAGGGVVSSGSAFVIAPFAETNTPTQNFGRATAPNGLKITPLARRLIEQSGIDLSGVAEAAKARGARRVGKAEVAAALAERGAGGPSPVPSPQRGGEARGPAPVQTRPADAPGERIAFNNIRQQTAARLQASWQTVPHVFQAVEVDFAAVDRIRQARKADFRARHGVSLTYLPFIARAVCIALAEFPRVNARFDGDGLLLNADINLGIAVDLSHEGLVVPVLKDAATLTAAGLAKGMARLAEKARAKALGPDDFAGGTYTITNNGSFGTLFTAAIINPPQVAILSTDAVRKRPVVVESEAGDAIAVHPVGMVAQSFDHRAFDGAYSAAYLQRVKQVLETHDWAVELG